MEEQDIVNQQLDELKNEGFKSLEGKERYKQYRRALNEYESHINCPYG